MHRSELSQRRPLFAVLILILAAWASKAQAQSSSNTGNPISQAGWTLLSVDSQETSCYNGAATNAFDGNPATLWHTQFCNGAPPTPHQISINLGASYNLTGFQYLPRQDGSACGWIKDYAFYISSDGVNWGTPVVTGTFSYAGLVTQCPGPGASVPPAQQITFAQTTGQYIKLVALDEINGHPWTSVAELNVFGTLSIVPQAGWSLLSVDSQETTCYNGAATNAFDGNPATMWHTQFCSSSPPTPHQISIDMGASYKMTGFLYLPRQDGSACGWIKDYAFYVSADGVNWGTAVATGTFNYTGLVTQCPGPGASVPPAQQITFPQITGQYIRLESLDEVNGHPWTSAAELNVLGALSGNGPLPSVMQVTVSPTIVVGGASTQGTVSLNAPAPIGGAVVSLASSNPSTTVPTTVTVPAGSFSTTFAITTTAVSAVTQLNISGSYNGSAQAAFTVNPGSLISQAGWSLLSVDSQETVCFNGAATNAFDGNPATIWHTQFCNGAPPPPHQISINLGGAYNLTGFQYLPRQDGSACGWIKDYAFYVSSDGVNWGTALATGTFSYAGLSTTCPGPGASLPAAIQIAFPQTTGQYIELVALDELNGNRWTSAAELNVLGTLATYSISGTLSPSTLGSGVTVVLSGAASATTTTDASGNYVLAGLINGSYTLTPIMIGGDIVTPSSQAVSVNGGNITGVNFAITVPTWSISGTISGSGGNGAIVALSGTASATTTANASGAYSFTGLTSGTYTVTSSLSGFTFTPASQNAIVSNANVTGVNFSTVTYTISGTISGAGGNGATVTLMQGATTIATVTASSSGAYTFSGLTNGSYTVTPSLSGFTFSPLGQTATVSNANVTGVNFSTVTYTVSGTISGAGGNDATVTLSGTASATTTANASGTYSFTGLSNGTYTVTPSLSGFTFAPASQNAIVSSANVAGVNFSTVTYAISGTLSGAGGNGATVTLMQGATTIATVTASSSGAYTFSGLTNGSYTVTPSLSGFTFTPGSQSATVNNADVTAVNFTTVTYTISGTISGAGGSSATVTLGGAASATTVSASGAYAFSGLINGNYTVTPSESYYIFSPTVEAATISGANVSDVNFTVSPAPITVSISPAAVSLLTGGVQQFTAAVSGTPNTDVTWTASGGTVSSSGLYTAPSKSGTYTLTAASAAETTKSASATVTVSAAVQHTVTLTWTAEASPVSGYNVYRGTVPGGPYTQMNTALDAATNYVDNTVVSGQTYYYVTTAVNTAGVESGYSNQVVAAVPSP